MISPGLLGSGPIRVVIDMVGAANGSVTASDVLSGLLQTRGEEGPALAADMFAAFIAAATVTSGRTEGGDGGSDLRSRVWLPERTHVVWIFLCTGVDSGGLCSVRVARESSACCSGASLCFWNSLREACVVCCLFELGVVCLLLSGVRTRTKCTHIPVVWHSISRVLSRVSSGWH